MSTFCRPTFPIDLLFPHGGASGTWTDLAARRRDRLSLPEQCHACRRCGGNERRNVRAIAAKFGQTQCGKGKGKG